MRVGPPTALRTYRDAARVSAALSACPVSSVCAREMIQLCALLKNNRRSRSIIYRSSSAARWSFAAATVQYVCTVLSQCVLG